MTGELVFLQNKDGSPKPLHWKCHAACQPLSDEEVDTIVSLREAFNQPMAEIRHTPVMMGVLTLIMTELQIIDHSHA